MSQAVFSSNVVDSYETAPVDRPWRRAALAALGVVCVGIAAVGVIVPGLPTAIWLIAASYLFMRSHPRLEAQLIRNRFFGPYLRYVDNPRSMPRRAKFVACGLMWTSVLVSVTMLHLRGTAGPWFAGSLIAAAALGTWVIARLKPKS